MGPVLFDADHLILFFNPTVANVVHPTTKKPVDRVGDRVRFYLTEMSRTRTRVIVPTPALSEFLVLAGSEGSDYLTRIEESFAFRVAGFDAQAAVEAAANLLSAIGAGDKKGGATGAWQKIKVDRQIIAIAKVTGCVAIHSNDKDIRKLAKEVGIPVVHVSELPLPPPESGLLPFEGPQQQALPAAVPVVETPPAAPPTTPEGS